MGGQNIIKPIIVFILYVLAQTLFGQHMVVGSYAFCFFYVAYLLSLPFEMDRVILLLVAFLLGISIDITYNTIGMHASSCVLMVYVRDIVKNWIRPGGGYEPGMEPTFQSMGFQWVFSYSILMIFIHHLFFFILEASNGALWVSTFMKAVASTVFTLVVTLILKSMNAKRKRR